MSAMILHRREACWVLLLFATLCGCSRERDLSGQVSPLSTQGIEAKEVRVEVTAVTAEAMRTAGARVLDRFRADSIRAATAAAQVRTNDWILQQLEAEVRAMIPEGLTVSRVVELQREIPERRQKEATTGIIVLPGKDDLADLLFTSPPIPAVLTDADGRFKLRVPADGWLLARVQGKRDAARNLPLWLLPVHDIQGDSVVLSGGSMIPDSEGLLKRLRSIHSTPELPLPDPLVPANPDLVAWADQARGKAAAWIAEARTVAEAVAAERVRVAGMARAKIESIHTTGGEPVPIPLGAAGIVVRWIPPGQFLMGSPRDEPERDTDEIQHTVLVNRGFFLSETECTQAQWNAVMDTNRCGIKGDDLPVNQVTWEEAREFCRRLTARHHQDGVLPAGWRWDLPTEAQWEYACRAGTTGAFAGDPDSMAWYARNAGSKPHAVKTRQANAWGLHDLHGNVWEWCLDWYGPYPLETSLDPTGPSSGTVRIYRGGNRIYGTRRCRSAVRGAFSPTLRSDYLGFRPALVFAR